MVCQLIHSTLSFAELKTYEPQVRLSSQQPNAVGFQKTVGDDKVPGDETVAKLLFSPKTEKIKTFLEKNNESLRKQDLWIEKHYQMRAEIRSEVMEAREFLIAEKNRQWNYLANNSSKINVAARQHILRQWIQVEAQFNKKIKDLQDKEFKDMLTFEAVLDKVKLDLREMDTRRKQLEFIEAEAKKVHVSQEPQLQCLVGLTEAVPVKKVVMLPEVPAPKKSFWNRVKTWW